MVSFFQIVWIEIQKISLKPRSYIGFLAITIIGGLIQFAMYMDGLSYIGFITQPMEQTFSIEGNILNGNLITLIILSMLILQIPLLIALVTGDLVSGEASIGTLRLLATKPVSRIKILYAKFIAGELYTLLIVLWLGFMSYGLGRLIFGSGDLIAMRSDGFVILPESDLFWRFVGAFGVAFVALTLISSLSFMFSCFVDNSIGPIAATMAIVILFTIIGTLEVPILDAIKPFLFTTHMIVWKNFFDSPLSPSLLIKSLSIMVGHIIIFLGVATIYFKRKDILI